MNYEPILFIITRHDALSYWRTSSGIEVDSIINGTIAIKIKSSQHISSHHLNTLRELQKDHQMKKRIVVSCVAVSRRTEDGIDILSVHDFIKQLWDGTLLS